MAIKIGIPSSGSLVDRQFVEIPGPDGTTTSYQFDKETKTLIRRESQIIIPSFHGHTHVVEDPIPEATQFLRGLMSAEDKAKVDAITQTRLGVLGFQGAGFPDDGGFLQGDIILAAGSEFISIERVGNIVRFTVDSPIPLSCNCEECAQIYWIQDESESRSVRPPSCNGIMPDISGYGELKIYAYPQNSIFNPNKPTEYFATKGEVPALIFKRYENGNDTNVAEMHVICKRREDLTTNVGWSMTPGSNGVPECVWFLGSDNDGRQIRFDFAKEDRPGLLGSVLYNGHTITRQNAIITGYTRDVLDTNIYLVRKWSVQDSKAIGDEFQSQNIWNFKNPNGGDATPETITLDKTIQLLDIGDVVEVYQFMIAEDKNGKPIYQSYFSKKPATNPSNVWSHSGGVKFGDLQEQRDELTFDPSPTGTNDPGAIISDVADVRLFEKTQWGITYFENDLLLSNDGEANANGDYEPGGTIINNSVQAKIDYDVPGLVVVNTPRDNRGDLNGNGIVDDEDLATLMRSINKSSGDPCYNDQADLNKDGIVDVRDLSILATNLNIGSAGNVDRPVWLWHKSAHDNFVFKAKIGLPTDKIQSFPPIDIVVGGPIDSVQDTYVKIKERGVYQTGPYSNLPFIKIEGASWHDTPSSGSLRILTGVYRDVIWKYQNKLFDGNDTILVGYDDIFPFDEDFILSYVGGTECTSVTGVTGGDITDVTGNTTNVTAEEMVSVPTGTLVAELVHSDYTTPAIRLAFIVNRTEDSESVTLQVFGGTLSMSQQYSYDDPDKITDDYVRGFLPGEFVISDPFVQVGFINDGIGANVTSEPANFRVYNGGFLPAPVGSAVEKWNELEIMRRGNQVWVWWNGLLVTPSPKKSSELPTPVAVNSPYFPINFDSSSKVGLRMWPGSLIREVTIKDQNIGFNEFVRGQLKINC